MLQSILESWYPKSFKPKLHWRIYNKNLRTVWEHIGFEAIVVMQIQKPISQIWLHFKFGRNISLSCVSQILRPMYIVLQFYSKLVSCLHYQLEEHMPWDEEASIFITCITFHYGSTMNMMLWSLQRCRNGHIEICIGLEWFTLIIIFKINTHILCFTLRYTFGFSSFEHRTTLDGYLLQEIWLRLRHLESFEFSVE